MAKVPSSAIGIDLGRHSFKAVHLQRKGQRLILTGFASRVVGEGADKDSDQLAHHLKLLLRDLGSSAKAYAVAVSSSAAILRIIEQPPTPTALLRDALRLNGLTLLNQDCREFVLDCDLIPSSGHEAASASQSPNKKLRYLVGGLPRTEVNQLHEAFAKSRVSADCLQLAPICNFNAFEHAQAEAGYGDAFLIVDIGHVETRVFAGCQRELVLVRSVEYGGKNFLDAVAEHEAIDRESAVTLVEQGDAGMTDAGRDSLASLAREIRSSIGFFEGQREVTIDRVYFSGALVKAEMPLQILSDELEMPCDTWDPFARCEISLPKNKVLLFDSERPHLNVACGAALELLHQGK